MNPKRRTTPKKDNSVPTKNMYSTLEGLESLCRRAMVYHETGEYVAPDPQPNICKNKYKKKAGPSKKVANEKKNKSTTFGKGRVGVSCEAYGVKHCACCNPHIYQNILSNETPIHNYAMNKITNKGCINENPILLDSDTYVDNSPTSKRFHSDIIDLLDSSPDSKINYNSSIINLDSDESKNMLDLNAGDKSTIDLDESTAVSLLHNRNCDDFVSSSRNVNLGNNNVIPTIDLSLNVDKGRLSPTEKFEIRKRLLTKREQIQNEIEECERNMKAIFAKEKVKYLLPKQTISTSPKIKEKVTLTRREHIQKDIDDCDRDLQKIFKKKTSIILSPTPFTNVNTTNFNQLNSGKNKVSISNKSPKRFTNGNIPKFNQLNSDKNNVSISNKSNLTSNIIPHNNIQNTTHNPVELQIQSILATFNNSRTPLQELDKISNKPANVDTSVTPHSHRFGCCPICFEDFENKELMSTICGHIFCAECIKKAIKTTRACPTCRNRLNLKRIHPIYL